MKKLNRIAALVGSAVLVTGCGFEQTINVKEEPAPALTGQFVDAPVGGLSYRSESFPDGTTNENGEFSFFVLVTITHHQNGLLVELQKKQHATLSLHVCRIL